MRPAKYLHNYPGVTTIVGFGSAFEFWHRSVAKKNPGKNPFDICDAIKKESQDIGHHVHDGIEKYLSGEPLNEIEKNLTLQEQKMLSILIEWCNKMEFQPVVMEQSRYSHKHQFAGTYDAHNIRFFTDWKTDKTPKCKRGKGDNLDREIKYGLQMGGYSIAEEEETGILINEAYVVRAAKNFDHDVYYFSDLTDYRKQFLILREAYKIIKRK